MAARPISLRLDEDARRALVVLMADGSSQSDVVRRALVEAAERLQGRADVRAEALRLAADPADRAESRRVLDELETLREPW